MRKRAQIRFFETVAVLVIFTILVVTGIFAYGKVRAANIEKQNKENLELQAINIARMAANMPELSCSKEVIENCIDEIKLKEASRVIGANFDYYFGLFKRSRINITIFYPEDRDPDLTKDGLIVYDYTKTLPNDGAEREKELAKLTRIANELPILIYNPITKRGSLGLIKIESFQ